jgi:hypothetical protein
MNFCRLRNSLEFLSSYLIVQKIQSSTSRPNCNLHLHFLQLMEGLLELLLTVHLKQEIEHGAMLEQCLVLVLLPNDAYELTQHDRVNCLYYRRFLLFFHKICKQQTRYLVCGNISRQNYVSISAFL